MDERTELEFLGGLNDAWSLLELAAFHYGDQIAIVDQACLLTYSDLYHRVSALIRWFISKGISKGDRIGILCRNSSHVIELHFAAAYLHAGETFQYSASYSANLLYKLNIDQIKMILFLRKYDNVLQNGCSCCQYKYSIGWP